MKKHISEMTADELAEFFDNRALNMDEPLYGIEYLESLSREQLVQIMDEHAYESGYEDFEKEELIEILKHI